MRKLLALPCMTAWTHMSYPSDPTICIEWRKAVQMAVSLVPKIILNPSGPVFRNYFVTPYAQFNWKLKTQYHFAEFKEFISPWDPPRLRCVYLFKSPFRWGKYSAFWPDPINLYTLFRDQPLLPDGTPDVLFSKSWWAWGFPPDPMFYTQEEWNIVTRWEKTVYHYNHKQRICVAMYEFEGERVTNTLTGQVGVVVGVAYPKREYETWHPGTPTAKGAVLQKLWMKMRPLIYKARVERCADCAKLESGVWPKRPRTDCLKCKYFEAPREVITRF